MKWGETKEGQTNGRPTFNPQGLYIAEPSNKENKDYYHRKLQKVVHIQAVK
jgi:hypothetical protein